jgi:molybdate transport system substrate-binding protein
MRWYLLLSLMLSSQVFSDEIKVLSGGAAKSLVDPLAASLKGHAVKMEYQPMGRLVQSLAGGAQVDMVIVTSEVFEKLQTEKKLAGGRPIARVGIGVAVHEKAPLPDISTVDSFKRTLLAAKSIVYIDPKTGTSGKHVADVFKKLNIEKEMQVKTTLSQGGYVTEPVGRGEIELGIHQISEILPVKGIVLVGPLPAEIQNFTVYAAGLGANAKESDAAKALLKALSGPAAAEVLKSKGMEPAGS